MNYLSVCSGIEAASVAWESLGWKSVGFSEIETFPCSVLAHRFPNVKNYGDMTRFKEWDINETVDLLVGGTPCQSFSVAGLRGGLDDDRGNLALTYCRILQRFKPRWFVWENVPGVFSSWSGDSPDSLGIEAGPGREMDLDETSDFASILAGFSELGYGYAWSVRDAQYFGVPQRRRRVFVVGYLGDWRRAAEVLFERGCVSGNPKKGSKKKQNVAGTLASRTSAGSGLGTDFDLSGGLQVAGAITQRIDRGGVNSEGFDNHLVPSITSHYGKGVDSDCTAPLIAHSLRGEGFDASEDGTGRGTPLVASPITSRPYGDRGAGEDRLVSCTLPASDGGVSSGYHPIVATSTGDVSHCLNAGGMGRQDYETETMIAYGISSDAIDRSGEGDGTAGQRAGLGIVPDRSPALRARHANAVAFSGRNRGDDGRGYNRPPNVTGDVAGAVDTVKPGNVAGPSIGVRRLTPLECERLQGFPDSWTLVPVRRANVKAEVDGDTIRLVDGVKMVMAADGPRYKSIGNSMAVPVMRWLGERIKSVEERIRTESIHCENGG